MDGADSTDIALGADCPPCPLKVLELESLRVFSAKIVQDPGDHMICTSQFNILRALLTSIGSSMLRSGAVGEVRHSQQYELAMEAKAIFYNYRHQDDQKL
jgi:hypothetical protein